MADRRRCGIARVTLQALATALQLDPAHRVIAILPADWEDLTTDSVRFVVEGPAMPELQAGRPPVVALPVKPSA